MSRIRPSLVAVTAILALVVAVPIAQARAHAPRVRVVTVAMTDFKFTWGGKVHAGKVTFRLVNKSKLAHDLQIAGKTSALVKPGKTGMLTVTLKKGRYPYRCTVKGHAAAGMKGVLVVL